MIVNYYEPGINFELKPKEAIDYFSAKGLTGSFNWYELINQQHDYAFTVAKMLDLDLLATVRSALDDALANGKTLDDFKRELIPILQKKGWWGRRDIIDPQTGQIVTAQLGSASRLETIFRTNLQSSYAAGQWEGIVAGADEMPYLLYDAVDDYRTRDDHRALNGRVYPIEHKFWLNYYPPNGWNCFVPETQISGSITGAIRRWYDGKVCEITTSSGRKITVTPNHPILTGNGWIIADKIDVGTNLLAYGGNVEADSCEVVQHKQAPTSAENLFETIRDQAFAVGDSSTLDFNSEANIREAEIDIYTRNSKLVNRIKASCTQRVEDREFVPAGDTRASPLNAVSAPNGNIIALNAIASKYERNSAFGAANSASDSPNGKPFVVIKPQDGAFEVVIPRSSSSPSRATLPSDCSRILFDNLPLNTFRLGLATQDNALFSELATNGIAADAGLFTYLVNTYPINVFSDPVVNVRKIDFSGHVYDFQSSETLIKADGLIVHNCRCGVIQLTADEVKEYGLKIGGDIPGPSSSWTNPITGEKMKIPFGIDPGFVHNSGISYLQKVQQLADEKIQKYAPDSQPAAKKGMEATQGKAQQVKAAQEAIQEEKAARRSGNETIFKGSLSFFDNLDRVVFTTQQEAEWVIAELKKEGYKKWPDGRELTDVIRYKGQD